MGGDVVAAPDVKGRRRTRPGIVELVHGYSALPVRIAARDLIEDAAARTSNLRMVTRGGVHGFCATDPPATAASLFGNDRQAIENARVHFPDIFSKCVLKSLNNQADFDSAIRRFDPSRPSHRYYQASSVLLPSAYLACASDDNALLIQRLFSSVHVLRPHLSSPASGRLELKTESN